MYSHISRSEARSFWGFKLYQLSARAYLTADERRVVERHRLERIEIFYDPARDQLDAAAAASHDKANAHGLFVVRARDAISIAASEIHALSSAVRALCAFRITVGDLLSGVTVTHRSLRNIAEVERVLMDCLDHIDRFLQSAGSYSAGTEDIFAPGVDDDTTPPADWPRMWRR